MRMTDTDMPFMALYDIQWWEEVLTDSHEAEFDFADIKVTKDYLSNGYRVLLYEFPNADKAPLVIAAEWMYHPYHFEMYQS